MADAREIELELRAFFEKEDNIRSSDRVACVMAILHKHFELDKIDHMVNHYDFELVVSTAKSMYPTSTIPVFLSKKEVHHSIASHILLLEAFIGYLNGKKLLKRLVKFDYRR